MLSCLCEIGKKYWDRGMGSWQMPSAGHGPIDGAQVHFSKAVLGFTEQLKHVVGHRAPWDRLELLMGLHTDCPHGIPPLGGSILGSEHWQWPLSSQKKFQQGLQL